MKKRYLFPLVSLILIFCLLLSACSDEIIIPTEESNRTTTTKKKTEKDPKKTEEAVVLQKDPKEDDILNVLMIGNSFCYYYPDELFGLAQAVGIKMKIGNVYYSGCRLNQHWTWLKNDEANYRFIVTEARGQSTRENYTLQRCLDFANWDMISLQQHFDIPKTLESVEASLASCEPYAGNLISHIQKKYPLSTLYWHQTWSYQVGYNKTNGAILDTASQQKMYESIRGASLSLCEKYGLVRIPSGDAWQIARKDPVVGDHLCGRYGNLEGDFYHDGDIGGGQYLNACVWFEVLTGQSCVGNSFRPDYGLPEEKVLALQQAAHRAVAASR